MRLTLLGTGTPAPSLKRQSSGYLFDVGGDVIVMDHGPGAHHRLLEAGRQSTEVTHLFFSHLHYDHCLDYPRMVLQRWDIGAGLIPDLKVFGPPPLKKMTHQLFGEGGVFEPDIRARMHHPASLDVLAVRGGSSPRLPPRPDVNEVVPDDVIKGPSWQITVGTASHVQPHLECYAYRLESDSGSVCYAGDSGGIAESVIELASECDVLIHMVHFESGTEPSEAYRRSVGSHADAAHVARRAGVKTLILTHLLEAIDRPGLREQIISSVSRIFDGQIIWGDDLMCLDVPFTNSGGAIEKPFQRSEKTLALV